MAKTIQEIETEFEALSELRDAAATAAAATKLAQQNVIDVTTVQQGLIDAATGTFDVETGLAKTEATDAALAETEAQAAEDEAFAALEADLKDFVGK